MNKIVITHIPARYMGYHRYLILGFHELKNQGKIKFSIKPSNLISALLYREFRFYYFIKKYCSFLLRSKKDSLTMHGYITDGKKKTYFAYDNDDTPYHFCIEELKRVSFYFKAQCPITIEEKGFEIAPGSFIKYQPEALQFKNKIYPSMLAPLYNCNNLYSYTELLAQYKTMLHESIKKEKMLMTYFGNARGPIPMESSIPDLFHNEEQLLGHFKGKVSHPNEKRAVASKIIAAMGSNYDARVIDDGFRDENKQLKNKHLFIPLATYNKHISQFKYNLNIAGYRTSIPYRFVQSFAVGTAILTDKLKVKWYRPFDKEVVETVEMGYRLMEDVDWDSFKQTVLNLPEITYEEVLTEFNEKWTPVAFASYIVNTLTAKTL